MSEEQQRKPGLSQRTIDKRNARERAKFETDAEGNFVRGNKHAFAMLLAREERARKAEAKKNRDTHITPPDAPQAERPNPVVMRHESMAFGSSPISLSNASNSSNSSTLGEGLPTVDVELCDGSTLRCYGYIVPA